MGVYKSCFCVKNTANIDVFAFSSQVAEVNLVALAPVRCLVNKVQFRGFQRVKLP